jgi:transcriptional regulator NrdR family protein
MECPFCEKGEARKAMLIHEARGVAFESEGYRCSKCGEEFTTWTQGQTIEEQLRKILNARETAVQASYRKLVPMPA